MNRIVWRSDSGSSDGAHSLLFSVGGQVSEAKRFLGPVRVEAGSPPTVLNHGKWAQIGCLSYCSHRTPRVTARRRVAPHLRVETGKDFDTIHDGNTLVVAAEPVAVTRPAIDHATRCLRFQLSELRDHAERAVADGGRAGTVSGVGADDHGATT